MAWCLVAATVTIHAAGFAVVFSRLCRSAMQVDPRFWPIPEVWTWASHMTVFLGHPPTKAEAFGFIGVHLVLAGLVLFLPGRAVAKWRRGRG